MLHIHKLKHHLLIAGHSFQLYNILQQVSSLVGAIIIVIAIFKLPLNQSTAKNNVICYWLILATVAMIIIIIRLIAGLELTQYGDLIVTAISALLIGLLVTSVVSKLKPAFLQKL